MTDPNPSHAPFAHFGGPTETQPPLPGSPAIDTALFLPSTPATDQRGLPRPTGAAPDIGAVEAAFLAAPPFTDTDADGINDLFEGPDGPYPHLTLGTDDSALDTDGDGSTDAREIQNHTDPFDNSSSFRVTDFTFIGNDPGTGDPMFDITLTTFPGLDYTLECHTTPDFSEPTDLNLGTATGFTTTTTVTLDPGGRDFVRARRN